MAKTLTDARTAKSLSQTALGVSYGVSQTYISELESGLRVNPTLAVVAKLEKALRCKLRFPVSDDQAVA